MITENPPAANDKVNTRHEKSECALAKNVSFFQMIFLPALWGQRLMQSASLRQKAQIEGEQADIAMITLVAGTGCLKS